MGENKNYSSNWLYTDGKQQYQSEFQKQFTLMKNYTINQWKIKK